MRIIFFISLCLVLVGCLNESDLPDGYKLLCSPEGKYSLSHPSFRGGQSANVWHTKLGAVRYARKWDKLIQPDYYYKSDNYDWSICQ